MAADAAGISDVIHRAAAPYGDRVALQDAAGARRLTYAEMWSGVERGAAALGHLGLNPGDRVLLALPSGPEWMPAFLSIAHAGLVAVPLPVDTHAGLARLVMMFAGIRAWIGDRRDAAWQAAVDGVPGITPADLDRHAGGPLDPARVDPASTAVVLLTSGSTARPRAVALTHAALRANLRALLAVRDGRPDETLLSTLPPSHAYELVAGQLAPLAAGARIVYAGAPMPNRVIETIRTQMVTRMAIVPALFEALVREVVDGLVTEGVVADACRQMTPMALAARTRAMPAAERERLRVAVRRHIGDAFRNVTIGGAATDPAWVEVLTAAGVDLDVGYGLTEAGPVVAVGRGGACPAGSVGRPLPGVDVRLAPDGEVLVRTEAAMQEYVGDSSATAAAFDGPWLRTGDRGRMDDAGFLFITGRIKEAIVTSAGESVYPDEIEPYYRSPLFAELAVVPAPGGDGNERPTLVVVPAGPVVDEAAIARAVASLKAAAPARLRVSGVVLRFDPLPRTAAGKIQRRALAEMLVPHEVRP